MQTKRTPNPPSISTSHSLALTLFTSDAGPLAKRYRLSADGALQPSTHAALFSGEARTVTVDGLHGLRELIEQATHQQAISFGVLRDGRDRAPIVTQSQLEHQPAAIARDRAHFEFPAAQPGFMLLDLDAEHTRNPVRDFVDARDRLALVVPAVRAAPMLWRASSSSHLRNHKTGAEVTGLRGQHVIIPVADASDIPRAGAALADRLWLAGHGRFAVSKSGQLLERTLIDSSVFQPERLIFIAPAQCDAPLRQVRAPIEIRGDVSALFDSQLIADLSPAEKQELETTKNGARALVAPEADHKRALFIEQKIEDWELDFDASSDELRELATAAITHGVLGPTFFLHSEDGIAVKVADILADPAKWHGRRFADPLEPDYRQDDRIAYLNADTGRGVVLYSHAHGGRRYTLQPIRSVIAIDAGESSRAADEALTVLRSRGDIYEHGSNSLVRITEGRFVRFNATHLQDYFGKTGAFKRFDKRADDWRPIDPPLLVANYILERHGQRDLPAVNGVITAPTLRPDGSVVDTPGYDERSKLFYDSVEALPPRISTDPTTAEASQALSVLWGPFARFEFSDDNARGVMLAALLTAVIRQSISTAPAFGFDAPSIGSGKTLLAKTVAALMGVRCEIKAPPDNDEEMRKYLTTCLMDGAPVICLDNVTQPIDGRRMPALCGFLTAAIFTDRVLGKNESVALPNRSLLLLTGNNLRVSADLCRRVLIARIDTRSETPYSRKFAFNPETMIQRDRIKYVRAALTLIRAAITHGDTFDSIGLGAPLAGSTASYEDWDTLVRQTVGWIAQSLDHCIGFADPTAAISEAIATDPSKEALRQMLLACRELFGEKSFTPGEALAKRRETEFEEGISIASALRELSNGPGEINGHRLGAWFEAHKGELADGFCFERGVFNARTKTRTWRVVTVG